MTINESLKELYVAMGGTEADVEDLDMIQEVLQKMKDVAGGAVPEVEAADKGKFLHADESTGELEWAEAGGGLPPIGLYDKGKYLRLNQSNEPEWVDDNAPIQLTVSGSNLVNTSVYGQSLYSGIKKVSKYYVLVGNDFSYDITWYSVVSTKYKLSPPTAEIVIKDDSTGNLYKHTGYDGTLNFAPYTP